MHLGLRNNSLAALRGRQALANAVKSNASADEVQAIVNGLVRSGYAHDAMEKLLQSHKLGDERVQAILAAAYPAAAEGEQQS